jgi:hypothetical protein
MLELKDKIAAELSPQMLEALTADTISEQQTLFSAQEVSEIPPTDYGAQRSEDEDELEM